MPGSDYTSANHTEEKLLPALTAFKRVLTVRWQKVVAQAIVGGSWDFPTSINRGAAAQYTPSLTGLWNFSSHPATMHIGPGHCSTLNQVLYDLDDEPEELVSCDGRTEPPLPSFEHREPVPPFIDCGVKSILDRVADWAWQERLHVFHRLPLFDGLDLGTIERAHDHLTRLGGHLGLQDASDSGVLSPFPKEAKDRDLPPRVAGMYREDKDYYDWWVGWTGMVASRARDGFFASVLPTMDNQAGIAGALANLYAYRAAIIEKGRNDALYWVQWATQSLRASKEEVTDYTGGWKVVQGAGLAATAMFAWTGAGGVAGATVSLAGFLGEQFFPEKREEGYLNGMVEVVEHLHTKLGELHAELDLLEESYEGFVRTLRSRIYNTHSYNLELYDFTANNPEGDHAEEGQAGGFTFSVSSVLSLARECYEVGGEYEGLLRFVVDTAEADPHLADKDGLPTGGDKVLMELRDRLESFLKTTCGRYLLAGDQIRDQAEAYVEIDTTYQDEFERFMHDWAGDGVGADDYGFDPANYAEETERSGRSGQLDDHDYGVESGS